MRREIFRFQSLGGVVKIRGNTVTLIRGIIPQEVANAFAKRIENLDEKQQMKIEVAA